MDFRNSTSLKNVCEVMIKTKVYIVSAVVTGYVLFTLRKGKRKATEFRKMNLK